MDDGRAIAKFGELVLKHLKAHVASGPPRRVQSEMWDVIALAIQAGLAKQAKYDPDLHHGIEGAEPGEYVLIWRDQWK